MYIVRSIMYIKNIYFVHAFYVYQSITNSLAICATYRLYTIHNTLMLYAVSSVFVIHYTVYRIHYKYIVEVLEKINRRMEMIDDSFERKFYGACYRLS